MGQKTLYVQGVFLVKVGCIFVIWVLGDVVLVGQKRANAPQLQNALAAVHNRQLVLDHQLFATMSSDELKKSVAKRLLVLQRSINLIQFIRLQIQHFISAFCFFMGNLL